MGFEMPAEITPQEQLDPKTEALARKAAMRIKYPSQFQDAPSPSQSTEQLIPSPDVIPEDADAKMKRISQEALKRAGETMAQSRAFLQRETMADAAESAAHLAELRKKIDRYLLKRDLGKPADDRDLIGSP